MRSKWLLGCIALVAGMAGTPGADSGCTGIGTTAGIALICSGPCGTGACGSHDGLDHKGAFEFCGCTDADKDSCCTVVIRDGCARPYGTCTACGSTGLCDLANNLPYGELNEPVCRDKKSHPLFGS